VPAEEAPDVKDIASPLSPDDEEPTTVKLPPAVSPEPTVIDIVPSGSAAQVVCCSFCDLLQEGESEESAMA
jgi:hypothetical protein